MHLYSEGLGKGWSHLWGQFHLQLTTEILPLKLHILSHIWRDHTLDLFGLKEQAQAKVIHSV